MRMYTLAAQESKTKEGGIMYEFIMGELIIIASGIVMEIHLQHNRNL